MSSQTSKPSPGPQRSVVDVAYLGPRGTFTEQAVRSLTGQGAVTESAVTVNGALAMVREGRAATAIVPFENSVEGSVSVTLDELIHGEPLVIVAETHVSVRFAVLASATMDLDRIRRLATHPHAAAQTRAWVSTHLPDAEVLPETSTARAAELVATGHYDGAIAAPLAAAQFDLAVLADDIADRSGAVTRFVQLALPGPPPVSTGADTTTLVAFLTHNHPGALLELLEQFSARGVDLNRLESRPTGEALGQYCFAIEANAHISEPRMAEALAGLHRSCAQVRYLGSYPRADGLPYPVPGPARAAAYDSARTWVASLTT
ncbi:MAG: prephenate dehydratase [Ornithinimicrobium sp.]